MARSFSNAYSGALDGLEVVVGAGPLVAIRSGGRAAVVGHPLWRREEEYWTDEQSMTTATLRAGGLDVEMVDVRQLRNQPESVYRVLLRGDG